MKKYLSLVIILLLLVSNIVFAKNEVEQYPTLKLYFENIQYDGAVGGLQIGNTTYIPLSPLSDFAGATLVWNSETQTVNVVTKQENSEEEPSVEEEKPVVEDKKALTRAEMLDLRKMTFKVNTYNHKGEPLSQSIGHLVDKNWVLTNYQPLKYAFTFDITDIDGHKIEFKDLDIDLVNEENDIAIISIKEVDLDVLKNEEEAVVVTIKDTEGETDNTDDNIEVVNLKSYEDMFKGYKELKEKNDTGYLLSSPFLTSKIVTKIKIVDLVELNERKYYKSSYRFTDKHLGSVIVDDYGYVLGIVTKVNIDGKEQYLINPTYYISQYIQDWFNTDYYDVVASVYEDGSTYFGEIDSQGYYNGWGKMVYKDGSAYIGYYKHGRFFGKGKSYYANGNIQEGSIADRRYNGFGEYTFPNGTQIKGMFVDGNVSGTATIYYANGTKSFGTFVKGKRSGIFIETQKNGKVYQVMYSNNQETERKFIKVTSAK